MPCRAPQSGTKRRSDAHCPETPALRQRLIRLAVESEFHVSLSRAQTLEVARLVTSWHGQKPLDLPGIRVERQGGRITAHNAEGGGLEVEIRVPLA